MYSHLAYYSAALLTIAQDESKPGLLLKVQSQVCNNIHQYTEKYEEEFEKFLGTFVQQVWDLLGKSTLDVKYDKVCTS